MTINISVRSFAKVERADIGVSTIALLAGPNENGKTSFCLAAAAALTGQTVPVDGIKKGSAGALVRVGDAEGGARVRSAQGEAVVSWPAATRETTGSPPEASVYAAGIASIVDLDDKARANALAAYLPGAVPSKDDLAVALKDAGIEAKYIDAVWKKIVDTDWDAAWAQAKDSGKKLKGGWEEITKVNFGTSAMKTWLPAYWSEDLAGSSLEKLDEAVVDARRALDAVIAGAAVDADKVERLKTDAALLPDLQTQNTKNAAVIIGLEDKIEKLTNERAAMPPATADSGMPCPHCGKKVRVRQVKQGVSQIEKAEDDLTPAKKKKRGDAIAVADGQLSNYRDKLTMARKQASELERDIGVSERAVQELAAIKDKTGDSGAVDAAREAHRIAEQRKLAFEAKTSADARALSITQNLAIQAVLAPDGLRKKTLGKALDGFNEKLAALSEAAGWKPVMIDADLSIKYGGRPYMRVWESQAYRVRAVLAVAMAEIDKSSMVILDAAGVLDSRGRNGLLDMLKMSGIPALVAMTFNSVKATPDLEAVGYGSTYWISQGVARPLADVTQAEAA